MSIKTKIQDFQGFTQHLASRVSQVSAKRIVAKLSAGFTIVELMIATAVFATVLLVALAAFLGIGKIYYKAISLTNTQDVAQQLTSQLSGDIQFAPTIVTNYPSGTGFSTGNGGSQFICLGNNRYTFNLYQKVNLDDHDNQVKFGLLRDTLPGSSGCSSPFGSGAVPLNNPVELLGNKMRLSKMDIVPAKDASNQVIGDLWDIDIVVAYGDDDVLQNPGAANVACNDNLGSTQFCSVSSQSTTVNRGL